jgi:hypothetical protein
MTKRYVETIQSEFRRALGLAGRRGFFDRYPVIDKSEIPEPVKGKKLRPKRMIQI